METIKQRYQALLDLMKRGSRAKEIEAFVRFLENETEWLTAPASTRYHLSKKGGLLEHSVGVAETLLKIGNFLLGDSISKESLALVGLWHDVGKAIGKISGEPKPYYVPNDNEYMAKIRGIPYIVNPEAVAMGTALRSLYLVAKFIPLKDHEAQSIAYHDGNYVSGYVIAHRECPLCLLLHFADGWHAAINEEGRVVDKNEGYFYGINKPRLGGNDEPDKAEKQDC